VAEFEVLIIIIIYKKTPEGSTISQCSRPSMQAKSNTQT